MTGARERNLFMWLSDVVVRMSDLRLAVVGSNPATTLPVIFPEVSC